MLTKQEILLGRDIWVESRRVREPRRTAVASGPQSQALVSGQSFWLSILPSDVGIAQPKWDSSEENSG